MAMCYYLAKKNKYSYIAEKASRKEVFAALNQAKYAMLVPVIVLGGIYGGITTPTEAAAIAVLYAFIAEFFILRVINLKDCVEIFKSSARSTAAIFIVVAAATAFGQLMLLYNVPNMIVDMLSGIASNKYMLLFVIIILLLVVGTFMDALASILILTPLLLPLVSGAGIDLTHFGIVMVVAVSLGFLTPPVGVNLFVGCGIAGLPIEKLSYAVLPFLGIMIVGLLILTYLPQITLIFI